MTYCRHVLSRMFSAHTPRLTETENATLVKSSEYVSDRVTLCSTVFIRVEDLAEFPDQWTLR